MTIERCDCLVVGSGPAGLSAAVFAAAGGLKVMLIEALDEIGGTLRVATGQMSGAGTSLQAERGIDDHPDAHYEDVMRITRGSAHPLLARKAVDLAPETIEWLRGLDFEFHPDCPAIVFNHEPYSRPRTYWGVDKGRSIIKAIEPVLRQWCEAGRIDLRLRTRMIDLQPDGPDRVGAVLVERADGLRTTVQADQIVLATGGYAGNPRLFAQLNGRPLYGPMHPMASGDGFEAATRIGAGQWCAEHFLPSMGGFEVSPGSQRVEWGERPQLTPQLRAPWEIFVDRRGARFIAEDDPSIDRREHAVAALDDLCFWVVFDAAIAAAAPPLFPQWPAGRMESLFGEHHAFVQADSVEALARACGIDPAGLKTSIARYNEALLTSASDPMGRQHRPRPIASPPYYAIRNHGVSIKGAAGLRIDPDFHVLRDSGGRIQNLRAIGEVIGGGLLSGHAYVGGMSITPALGFGRALGRALAAR